MITGKEIIGLLLALIILAFSNSFKGILASNPSIFINSLFIFAIILIIYTASKKLTAYYYETEEETKLWTFQRYGFYEKSYFKNPIPIGVILSFLLSVVTLGYVKWFAVTESEIKTTPARAVKRHDIYSFSEITDYHLAVISAAGIFFCFLLAIVAYFLNFTDLARLSVFFACFNLLPLGKLDGSRIFFGSRLLYTVLVLIALIALVYVFLVP